MPFDIDRVKNVHFVGIGGCGMSAIAKILHEMKFKITGSDIKESSNTIRLKDAGIKVYIGHSATYLRGADLLVYSAAIPKDNVELLEAKAAKIKMIPRAEALAWIMEQSKIRIGVAGTHGKTTTTSMIAHLLTRLNFDPTYLVGGEANDVDGNAHLGATSLCVAEADESDGSFLKLKPTIAVITNIEADHMEFFGNIETVIDFFAKYAESLPEDGTLIIGDGIGSRRLLEGIRKNIKYISYGINDNGDMRAVNPTFKEGRSRFEVYYKGRYLGEIILPVPGMQNVINSLAAIAACMELGCDFPRIATELQFFSPVRRRFELIGEVDDILIFDDYAHHPTELRETLKAARGGWGFNRRLLCVFQPHRFTRTMYLHEEFGDAFRDADIAIITEIYSAGENPLPAVSAKLIVDAVKKNGQNEVVYIGKKEKIAEYLESIIKPSDIIITCGAGDIHTVAKELYSRLKKDEENSTL